MRCGAARHEAGTAAPERHREPNRNDRQENHHDHRRAARDPSRHDRPRQADGVRVPRRRRGRRRPERGPGRDGRPARLLPGAGRARADHRHRAGPADVDRRQVRPRVAERPGCGLVPLLRPVRPGRTRSARSTRSRSPTRPARPSCRACSRSPTAPSGTRRGSSSWPGAATGSAGTTTTPTCTRAANGSSGPATSPTWSTPGCPPWTAWWTSCSRGGRVADIGCGFGASTVLMASAFPASRFVGSDYHEASIETARERAAEAGVGETSAVRGGARRPGSPGAASTW